MGLNAYFAFQVVGTNGKGSISYEIALTAVFVEGIIFIFLALTGMRQWLVKLIPATIKTATGVGIGLFLTEIGLSYSAGIGVITGGFKATPLAIAGCPEENISEKTQMCAGKLMSNPKVGFSRTLNDSGLTIRLDVDGHLCRWHCDGFFDVLSCQICPHHRHCSRLDSILAVRESLLS